MNYTLLFDLDDTLLDTNIESFIPAYFQAFSEYMTPYVKPEVMLPALLSATQLMMESEDPSRTLEEVFDDDFYRRISVSKNDISELVDDFYDDIFPELNVTTDSRPDAVPLIEWAVSQGFRVAIATDPLFPRKATHHRLRWAGFDPEQFELISTFENFHFSKTYPSYYAEMLGQLGWPEGPVVMIGNDVHRDLLPADRLGLTTYLIGDESASTPGPEAGRGQLADFRPWLESQDPSALEPSFKSPEAILAIMSSTPAVLSSLIGSLPEAQWVCEPSSNDWTLNEVVCHLCDTDIEIHAQQLQLMIEKENAFIPRPDSSIWANEREYLQVSGMEKLREFTSARIQNINAIKNMDESLWSRKARHTIFGPTNFTEVVSFIADHDRAHIQQVWKTLKAIQCERV
jgi:FMN phosphatase YigB (HAD superfamily)